MKKVITLLAVCVLAINLMAEGHLKFKGVEIDGTPEAFVKKMEGKGLTYLVKNAGVDMMTGDFAGYHDCLIGITSSNNLVARVNVVMKDNFSTWSLLYHQYTTLKDMLTQKYGEPANDIEIWQTTPAPTDDSSKMYEMKMDRAKIGAEYKTPEGSIEIMIMNVQMQCCILISYFDAININKATSNALEDL